MSSDRRTRWGGGAFASCILWVWLAGCAMLENTEAPNSAVDLYPGDDLEFEFWDELATRPVTTNHDALYGFLLLNGVGEYGSSYEDRLEAVADLGWLDAGVAPPPNQSASVGLISKIACDLLDVRRGFTLTLFGSTERYCTRELVYQGVLPYRTENQSLTGLEFVDLVGVIEDQMEREP